jgi:hypothetical protein
MGYDVAAHYGGRPGHGANVGSIKGLVLMRKLETIYLDIFIQPYSFDCSILASSSMILCHA